MGKLVRRTPGRESKKELTIGRGRKIKIQMAGVQKALVDCRGMVTYAAKQLGTTYDNLTRYIKANPKLESLIVALQERRLDFAESKLDALIEKEDKTAIIFFLKTKGKKRGYIEDEKMDLSKLTQPITFIYQPAVQSPKDPVK